MTEYVRLKGEALNKPDDAPYPDAGGQMQLIIASQKWWKQWFVDETPIIDHLAEFRGAASFHFGEIDSQLPARRQVAFGEDRVRHRSFAWAPRLVLHERCGHVLRIDEPSLGPIDVSAKKLLVEEILAAL